MRGEDPPENCRVIGRFEVGVQQAEVAEVWKVVRHIRLSKKHRFQTNITFIVLGRLIKHN